MSMHIERRVERLTTGAPGHLESHPTQHDLAHSPCTLLLPDAEDLNTIICDPIQEDEMWLGARMDEDSCKLRQQFLRAHGRPKGELTTLSSRSVRGSDGHRNSQHDE